MPDYSAFPITEGIRTYLAKPEEYVVDFDNPARFHEVTLYCVIGIGNVVALMFIVQRMYTKLVLTTGLQLDDAFLIASWLCSLTVQGATLWSVVIGARGVHGWEMPIERFVKYRISVYIGGAMFIPCASFAKGALLIFYWRLSPQKVFRYMILATASLIIGSSIGIFVALLFACKPIETYWKIELGGECVETTQLFIATSIFNSLTDLLLFVLPIPTVWTLKMPLSQRIGVLALFSVGLITIITSVIRAAILPKMSGPDQTWVTAEASIWSQLECNLIVICGTVPTLRVFLRHVCPRLLGSSINSSSLNTPGPNSQPQRAGTGGRGGSAYRFSHRKNPYAQFEEEEASEDVEMAPWDRRNGNKGLNSSVSTTIVIGGNRSKISEDDNSEKAIMETKSVIVQRE